MLLQDRQTTEAPDGHRCGVDPPSQWPGEKWPGMASNLLLWQGKSDEPWDFLPGTLLTLAKSWTLGS